MKHIHLDSTTSTQDYLFNIIHDHNTEDLLVSASHQTHGRGRGTNHWLELGNSLFCSFTLAPNPNITFTAIEVAVLTHLFFLENYNLNIFLKWPNDLYSSDGKKLGGILIQKKGNTPYVIGIGLNLYIHDTSQSQYAALFTSPPDIEIKELSLKLYKFIQEHRLPNHELKKIWTHHCLHMNKQVEIHEGVKTQGKFVGIDNSGAALIEDLQGNLISHFNGSLIIL
jgi:BirA family transcriptional regulator, biotin operon repressor / biotin---[acetyl-CoA-carboxylase] ligase